MSKQYSLVLFEDIEQKIFLIRGQRVMIDRDIANLYQVETKHLNRQVKRNYERFPVEFMFQLTSEEKDQLVTNWHRFMSLKHSTSRPYAFTEHGVAMLSSVLKSKRAIQVNIQIIRTFIRLRQIASTHKDLSRKLEPLLIRDLVSRKALVPASIGRILPKHDITFCPKDSFGGSGTERA